MQMKAHTSTKPLTRKAVALWLCWAIVSSSAWAQGEAPPANPTPAASPPSPIVAPTPSTSLQLGSGFVVSEGYVLTAHHVVQGRSQIYVGPVANNRWVLAELVKTDPKLDIALLKAKVVMPALAFANSMEVPTGLEVFVLGYPQPRVQGMSKKITQGIVNGNRSAPGQTETHQFQISAEVAMGNSGGPVLAPDGLVIGMVQQKLNSQTIADRTKDFLVNVSYALKSEQLLKFLEDSPIALEVNSQVKRLSLNKVLRPYQIFEQSQGSVVSVIGRTANTETAVKP
jgi:S1-C subfamily serine protease